MTTTTDQTSPIREHIERVATEAAQAWLNIHGDRDCCGFAWVVIKPKHKGNTKLGKAERKLYAAIGAEYVEYNKAFHIANVSHVNAQSMTALEMGAKAAAEVLQKDYGIDAYMSSRID